jgi:hypothetical protein
VSQPDWVQWQQLYNNPERVDPAMLAIQAQRGLSRFHQLFVL